MTTRKVNLDDLVIKGLTKKEDKGKSEAVYTNEGFEFVPAKQIDPEMLAIREKLATAKIGEFVYFADLAIDREWKGFSVGIRNKNRDNAKRFAINTIRTAARGLRMKVSIYWVPSKGQTLVPRVEVKSK